jgi:hypothetical protein
MALNGSELIDQPWNTTLGPFNNLFNHITGVPETLWLFIVIVLTFGVFIASEKNPLYTSMFMICSGSILAGGGLFTGVPIMAAIFTVFTGLGIASMFVSIYLQRR